jgi:hypothetical protein
MNINTTVGAWGNYDTESKLFHAGLTMPDGHSMQFFVNRETGLVVVDYAHKNDKGGTELLRKTLDPKTMLAHCERKKRTA